MDISAVRVYIKATGSQNCIDTSDDDSKNKNALHCRASS